MFMIATGGLAELSPKPINYIWYTVSSITFIFILVLLFTDVTAYARNKPDDVVRLFRNLRNVNTVVWIGYPLIWILGTAGFNLFGVGTQSMLYTILDIVSKVGFGLIIVARRPAVARSAQLAPPQMAT
jgi:bacteriorhodopsin